MCQDWWNCTEGGLITPELITIIIPVMMHSYWYCLTHRNTSLITRNWTSTIPCLSSHGLYKELTEVLVEIADRLKTSFASKSRQCWKSSEMTYAHILAETFPGCVIFSSTKYRWCLSGQLSKFSIFCIVHGFWSSGKFALKW